MLAPTKLARAEEIMMPGDTIPFYAGQFVGNISNATTASCTISLGKKIDESVQGARFRVCTATVMNYNTTLANQIAFSGTSETTPYVTIQIADKSIGLLRAIFHYSSTSVTSGICMATLYGPDGSGNIRTEIEFY